MGSIIHFADLLSNCWPKKVFNVDRILTGKKSTIARVKINGIIIRQKGNTQIQILFNGLQNLNSPTE